MSHSIHVESYQVKARSWVLCTEQFFIHLNIIDSDDATK